MEKWIRCILYLRYIPLLAFVLMLFSYYQSLFPNKESRRIYINIGIMSLVLSLGYSRFLKDTVLYPLIIGIFIVILTSEYKLSKKISAFLVGEIVFYLLLIKNVLYFAVALIQGTSVQWVVSSEDTRNLVTFFLFVAAGFFLFLFRRIYPRKRILLFLENEAAINILTLMEYALSVCFMLLIYVFSILEIQGGIYLYHIFTLIISGLVYTLVFYLFVFWTEKLRAEQAAEKISLLNTRSMEYYEMELAAMQELRRARHDYKNKLFIMRCLLEQGQTEELRQYLGEQESETGRFNTEQLCNNKILNYILTREKAGFEAEGIEFFAALYIPEIRVKDSDLYLIFLNLLNNCREALRQKKDGERFLRIHGEEGDGKYTVCFENSYTGTIVLDERGAIVSSKKDKVNHGLGLGIVRAIAEKNGGSIRYSYDSERKRFQVSLSFYVCGEKGNGK